MKPDLWINGQFTPWDNASVHPLCHSLQRGSTLFESIDCKQAADGRPAIFRLIDHIIRLENSAQIVGMKLPYSVDEICDATAATVARSGLKSCTIRPLAFYADPVFDVYPGDIPVTVVIGIGFSHPSPDQLNVKIAGMRKIDSLSMPLKAKVSGNYIGPMIAKTDAIRSGFDDALILDHEGFVAEGTTANIFIVENGSLVTAPDDVILPGITRDTVTVIADHIGIPVVRDTFTPDRLFAAEEVILCSSGKKVVPIVRVDERVIGDGSAGPITRKLRAFYHDVITGLVPEFVRWLTYVG